LSSEIDTPDGNFTSPDNRGIYTLIGLKSESAKNISVESQLFGFGGKAGLGTAPHRK
jgi:hypothetical protein